MTATAIKISSDGDTAVYENTRGKKFTVQARRGSHLFEIIPEGYGGVPAFLDGLYTTKNYAEKRLVEYLEAGGNVKMPSRYLKKKVKASKDLFEAE